MTATTGTGPTNAMFAEAHTEPKFDLAVEPWLPVLRPDNTFDTLSLQQFLLQAHTFVDLTEPEPLTRAGIMRFLIPLTAALIRETREGHPDPAPWVDRYRRNSGFTPDEVAALLSALADRLWLYHPKYPFMQHPALTHTKSKSPEWAPVHGLTPTVPGVTSAMWFQRPGDPRVNESMTCAEAARGLLYRRAYVLPGKRGGWDCGGTFSESVATCTHVFRRDATSMFRTLLRNMTPEMFDTGRHGQPDGLAWLDEDPQPNGTVLYQSTLSVTNVLLGPAVDGTVAHIRVRRELDKGAAKEIREAARGADRHTIFVPKTLKAGDDGPADISELFNQDIPASAQPEGWRAIRLEPRLHRVERLGKLMGESGRDLARQVPFGVVSVTRLWIDVPCDDEALTFVLAEKAGSAYSAKYADTGIIHVPIHLFENTGTWPRRRRGDLAAIVSTLTGPGTKSMKAQLGWALKQTVMVNPNTRSPLAGRVEADWLAAAGFAVDDFTSGAANKDDVLDAMRAVTLDMFDRYTDAYATDPKYAAKIVAARQRLRSSL